MHVMTIALLLWIEKVLKPDAESAYIKVAPFLLLDIHHCHTMTSVFKKNS